MLAALNKKFMWFIVAWFAILQTVAPFVHGHLGVDSAAQGHGLHIHMQEVAQSSVLQSDYAAHTLQNADIEVHTVGINDAVLKNIDLLTAPLSAVLFVLFSFGLAIIWLKPSASLPASLYLFLHPQSTPRAPPAL